MGFSTAHGGNSFVKRPAHRSAPNTGTMKPHLTLLAMTITTALHVCAQPSIAAQPNWLASIRQCLGPQVNADWLLDLEGDSVHLFVIAEHTLLIVDRAPMTTIGDSATLRPCILSLGGTRLDRTGAVAAVNDSVLVGSYRGTLGGQRVLMEQYVYMRHGVLLAKAHVVRRCEGSAPVPPRVYDAVACSLLVERAAAVPVPPAEQITTNSE